MSYLANDYSTVVRSPSPADVYCYSPGILALPGGRLIATMDFGGKGVRNLKNAVPERPQEPDARWQLGRIYLSDDGGVTWKHVCDNPFMHARPFCAGDRLYVLGHYEEYGELGIVCSEDFGQTWSAPAALTAGQHWHAAPCNVLHEKGCVYLVMEQVMRDTGKWPVNVLAPVVMRAPETADLTRPESWTFSSRLTFEEAVHFDGKYFGMPLYADHLTADYGWLETNLARLRRPADIFCDESGRTLHLFMRTWCGLPGFGALAKAVENEDGTITVMLEKTPGDTPITMIPIPGGGTSKFHILYDDRTATYWLLTNDVTDSTTDWRKLQGQRTAGNNRHRLVLYYSCNCFDWIFGGAVATGGEGGRSRSYASMDIDGKDLVVLSRSGDEQAKDGHDTNLITFHRVKNFRNLIDTEF